MRTRQILTIVLVALAALALAACGSSKKKSSSTSTSGTSAQTVALSLGIAEKGKKASFTGAASTQGGVVNVTLQNTGKKPHEAQFARMDPGHTVKDVLKALGGQGPPPWAHLVGGVSAIAPGQTGTATLSLQAGNYVVIDTSMGPGGGGPPAVKTLKVTGGAGGSLPSTPTTITAASPAKDKYKWDVNGSLKAGDNRVTFVSKGDPKAIHFIGAFRVKGKVSDAQIQKALNSNRKPPPFVDRPTFASTTILDSGKSAVVSLSLKKPGEYVLFCPLKDRDGGKQHDHEGLVTRVSVK
jgi:hypothetical protein